ncbi:MAG: neutral zinc metallopeptidase [Pseudomonadota bacterium]
MRWKQGRRSSNVDDRRGRKRVPGGAKLGGGAIIIALVAAVLFGQDPLVVLQQLSSGTSSTQTQASAPRSPAEDQAAEFSRVVLADTEDVWNRLFAQSGSRYQEPVLVLYTDVTNTACGVGQAASGPFYCPGDNQLYIDLGFLGELKRLGAPGDFAFAYVIAHEVGHHVQNLIGVARQVHTEKQRSSQRDANALQVKMELQADCFAGLWAHHAQQQRQILEAGDVEEGLSAAAAVGDDRLQRAAGRRVQPETFTHGTSEQRMQWFRRGLETGSVDACNTFR